MKKETEKIMKLSAFGYQLSAVSDRRQATGDKRYGKRDRKRL